jgi:DNA-binding PadR family transcriptional regulator
MRRDKNLPLTETVYYILLALTKPTHGYVLMQKVEELSDGQVRLAAGTLYGAIENLLKKGFITSMPSDDVRRKVYAISQAGEQILRADYQRMTHMLSATEQILNWSETK